VITQLQAFPALAKVIGHSDWLDNPDYNTPEARLPRLKQIFAEWLHTHVPERAEHVLSIVRQMRGGRDYDATFGSRMRGEGEFAELLRQRFALGCRKPCPISVTPRPSPVACTCAPIEVAYADCRGDRR